MSILSYREEPSHLPILIVDSHLAVAEMTAVFLNSKRLNYLHVIGEASTPEEGLHLFQKRRPSMVISGLEFSTMGGPEMLRRMRAENPELLTLIHTGTSNLNLLHGALEMEPRGFVHKSESLRTFNQAFELVAEGKSYRSPYATALLDRKRREEPAAERLTTPEQTLVRLIAQGLGTKQIAAHLHLSPKTVENYRKQVMTKLGLNGVAQLAVHAVRQGMLD